MKKTYVFQVIKQSCAKVLICTYCSTSEDATIMTSIIEQICSILNCSCTSLADLLYLAFHSNTLISCLKFIFSIMKRSQQNWSEDLCGFQILTMAQACDKIMMATIYTKSKQCSVTSFIPLFVGSMTSHFNIQQTPKSLMFHTWPRFTKHTAINNTFQIFTHH